MRLEDIAESPHFKEHAELADPARVLRASPSLTEAGPQDLARTVEDRSTPLPQRVAAGAVLALIGDPRVPLPAPGVLPAARHVPAARVPVGLPEGDVQRVAAQWSHVGVEESWIAKEAPEHGVSLGDYWIATYPVTNAEYREFLEHTGDTERPTTWYLGAYPWDRANHPVAGVSPQAADAYARWLSERTGHSWRLPSEAEWEYAAKGPDGLEFPWGSIFSSQAANTRETGVHTTTPVGAFPDGVSPFGLHDMGGNVEEYVADTYVPYPGGPFVEDHLVQTMGDYRVARGGSFARFGDLTRTRRRHGAFPGPLYPVGFRLATGERPS
ncbi:MAG TPA: SUMF1/EgtB/PvdO family nonheme iron enzyme [Streptomyces sp.]|nr:SUMF1/EgtB/PvdO family nonheme iron enzyme [Streptomyces sp.]